MAGVTAKHATIIQFFVTLIIICGVSGQNEIVNNTETSTDSIASTVSDLPKNISCEVFNNDCKACVENTQCYYCDTDNKCNFHVERIIADGECDIKEVHFWTCKMNLKVMLILIGTLCGIALLVITIFCCYCCCKKRGVKLSKDDLKFARQREERKQIAALKRKERAERTEEIRRKYGLVKDTNPYQRFDA
ncbi:Pituitary tumor-transforming 1 protein-interacting protein, partial [Stegodyphus mimosarum]